MLLAGAARVDTCSASHPGPQHRGHAGPLRPISGEEVRPGGGGSVTGDALARARRPLAFTCFGPTRTLRSSRPRARCFSWEPAPMPPSGAPSQQQGLRHVSVTPWCEGSWGLSHRRHTPRWALLAPSWGVGEEQKGRGCPAWTPPWAIF